MEDLHRTYIDVEIEAEFKRGLYEGTRSLDTKQFRVVGVLIADADDYHMYITNLSREELLPTDIAEIYRCRREVELVFRELKMQYELDEFNTSKPHVVKILLYAALLSLLVSRICWIWSLSTRTMRSCFHQNAKRRPSGRTPSSFFTNSVTTSATRHRHCWSG